MATASILRRQGLLPRIGWQADGRDDAPHRDVMIEP